MEQEILALFEKVLSRKVGFHDELIESDILDSILAVDMVLEVQDVYGCMIPPTDVATVLKTPADLARQAQRVAMIGYAMERPEGLRRDLLHCYDLMMPDSFEPRAVDGEGIPELVAELDRHAEHLRATGQLEERRMRNLRKEVLAIATLRLRAELERSLEEDPQLASLLEQVGSRSLDPASAASELLVQRQRASA